MPIDDDGNFHPGFMAKIEGFTLTFAQWAAEGFPRRDPVEVAELFAEHCNPTDNPCEYYDPDSRSIPLIGKKGICRGCGCHVSADATELTNFLTFPVTPCPLGKFKACVDSEEESD